MNMAPQNPLDHIKGVHYVKKCSRVGDNLLIKPGASDFNGVVMQADQRIKLSLRCSLQRFFEQSQLLRAQLTATLARYL